MTIMPSTHMPSCSEQVTRIIETLFYNTTVQLLGQGVEVDLTKAADILSDLAMKGHPYAQVCGVNLIALL